MTPYRGSGYDDEPDEPVPDWELVHAGYFSDARDGLGMSIQRARLYAEENVAADREAYRRRRAHRRLRTGR